MAQSANGGDPLDVALTAVAIASSRPDDVAALTSRARALAPDDRAVESACLRAHAIAAWGRGEMVAAVALGRDAVRVADAGGAVDRAAEARGSLSLFLVMTGDGEGALRELARAMPVLRGLPAVRLRMQHALVLDEIGRLDDAVRGYDRALSALRTTGDDPLIEGDIRNNRSIVLTRLRRWREAEHDLEWAEKLYDRAGHGARNASVYLNRAAAAAVQGAVPTALEFFDESARRFREAGRSVGLVPVEKAEVLLSVGLASEARAAAAEAAAEFERAGNATDLAQSKLVLAQAALVADDPEGALSEAEAAERIYVRLHRPGWAALARHVALRASWELGRIDDTTLRSGRRTAAALAAAGWSAQAVDARLIVARIALASGRIRIARQELATTAADRTRGPADVRARAWHAEALLRLNDGDRSGAERALRSGLTVLERFRAGLGAFELRASAAGEAGELATLGARLAVADGRADAAIGWAERWRASALQFRSALPPADAILRDDLAELRQIVSAVAEAATAGRSTAALVRLQAQLESSVRTRSRHAAGSLAERTPRWSLAELRRRLAGRALVEYLALDGRLHAVVVAPRRTTLHDLGPLRDVTTRVDELLFGLRRMAFAGASRGATATERITSTVQRVAADLDTLLLAPLDLPGSDLVVVPTGVLHGVPWPVLPTCAGRAVSVSPSASLWLRASAQESAAGPVVLAAGPRLDHADAEIRELATAYPHALRFTGAAADVGTVSAALDGAAVAHLAAHGRLRTDNPLFSALEFADGPLTVYDLERLAEPPGLVVLSACDAGRSAVRPGDELLGLASALLAMGTRTLVAAVLPVDDSVTGELMVGLHRHLVAGKAAAAALVAARAELSPERAYQAAGFLCFGAG